MNRRDQIVMAAIAASAALHGCAIAPASEHAGAARNAWAQCIQAAIPRFDDSQSSSEIVARAAMKSCSAEYTAMAQASTGTLAKAQRDALQAATDDVVNARIAVANAQVLKCQ